MARSTTTIANERSNFDLIDPLLKLEEERNPRTAFGGTIGGRTFYELMRDPTVSFTEEKEEVTTTPPPIDTLRIGEQMLPIESDTTEAPALDETVLDIFNAVQEQQQREGLPSIYETSRELRDDRPIEYKGDASAAAINSFAEKEKTFTSHVPDRVEERARKVSNFVKDPVNLNPTQASTVSGLTPKIDGKTFDTRKKANNDIRAIDPKVRANSFKDLDPDGTAKRQGALGAALHSLDAVRSVDLNRSMNVYDKDTGKTSPEAAFSLVPDDIFLQVAAINAEEYFASTVNSRDIFFDNKSNKDKPRVAIEQQNETLGREIIKAYRKATNQNPDTDIVKEEATTIGDFAKNIYQQANPELVERVAGNYANNERAYFQLTFEGDKQLNDPEVLPYRKRLIDKARTRVRKNRIVASIDANKISGNRKGVKFSKASDEALNFLDNVPIVIDNRRFSILLQTALGFITSRPDLSNYLDSYMRAPDSDRWKLDILGIGASKITDLEVQYKMTQAKNKIKRYNNEPIVPQLEIVEHLRVEYDKAVKELITDIKSLSVELGDVFYFNHGRQGFAGRIQGSDHDLSYHKSKVVRALIRSPNVYLVKEGSRAEANLRQMYAMVLADTHATSVNELLLTYDKSMGTLNQRINMREIALQRRNIKGSEALPMMREKLLDLFSDKLEGWGDRLKQAYVTDPEAIQAFTESFSTEVKKENVNVITVADRTSNTRLPNVKLDFERDAELIDAISDKGMDGLLFIEGLIEFSDYAKWKRNKTGKPFRAKFNAHTDGKTSGTAILAQFLGNQDTSFLTGGVRYNNYTLTDRGDIRDKLTYELKKNMSMIPSSELYKGTTFKNLSAGVTNRTIPELLNSIADVIFTDRSLNKNSMMTIPYGVEFDTLRGKVEESIRKSYSERNNILEEKSTRDPDDMFSFAIDLLENSNNFNNAVSALHKVYIDHGVSQVLDPFVLEYKSIMRSFTKLSQAMNTPIPIKAADGSYLVLSRKSSGGIDTETSPVQYQIGNKKYSVSRYIVVEDMTGTKENINPETGFNEAFIGDDDFSAGISMLIHGADGSIQALTFSGESLKRLKIAVGEDPDSYVSNAYGLSLYDADMVDVGSYDTIIREANKHFNKLTEYNVGEEITKSLIQYYDNFMKSLNYVEDVVNNSQDNNQPLKRRSDSDLLSDREKAFIVDLLSHNSEYKKDKKSGDVTNPLSNDPDLAKFTNRSQFVVSLENGYFNVKNTDRDLPKMSVRLREYSGPDFPVTADREVVEEIIELSEQFDVFPPENYKPRMAELDVAFLKKFLKLYQTYLFGKDFSRLRRFTKETKQRQIKLKSFIDKYGYKVYDENGKEIGIDVQYLGS